MKFHTEKVDNCYKLYKKYQCDADGSIIKAIDVAISAKRFLLFCGVDLSMVTKYELVYKKEVSLFVIDLTKGNNDGDETGTAGTSS